MGVALKYNGLGAYIQWEWRIHPMERDVYIQWQWLIHPLGVAHTSNGGGVYIQWRRRIHPMGEAYTSNGRGRIHPMRVAHTSNGRGVYIQRRQRRGFFLRFCSRCRDYRGEPFRKGAVIMTSTPVMMTSWLTASLSDTIVQRMLHCIIQIFHDILNYFNICNKYNNMPHTY